jgi:hypothetical protein
MLIAAGKFKVNVVLNPNKYSIYANRFIRVGFKNCVDNSSQSTRPIESSVQSPNYLKISSQPTSSTLRYQMRDLFKRRKRLADWIKRVNDDVDEPEIEQIYLKTH